MDDTPDLGRMIAYCSRLRQAGYDVTPVQSRMLIYLTCCCDGRPVNQRDLEQELRLRPSTINGIVNRLEEKDYILRRTSPEDGRCRLISLTEAGRVKAETFRATLDDAGRRLASCLTEEEAGVMRDLLARIIENLENEVNKV